MSSYFDEFDAAVRGIFHEHGEDPERIAEEYQELEAAMISTVSLATGDREFPEPLRERIQGIIATKRVFGPAEVNQHELLALLAMHKSFLSSDLHSAFHDVARSNTETRFGMLSDNPAGIVSRRDSHDSGEDDDFEM